MAGIYQGLRVIEFSGDVAGSFTGQICADRGAEVIKIEPPGGDRLRHRNPYQASESKSFQAHNRGKQSVVLDLHKAQGLNITLDLVASADIVIMSLPLAGRYESLAYDALRQSSPRLIYVDINAFGRKGYWADKPANDLVIQAYGGTMISEGKTLDDGVTPLPVQSTSMPEYGTGYLAAIGISAALFHRERKGEGQCVTLSRLLTLLGLQSARVVPNPMADQRTAEAKEKLLASRTAGAGLKEIRQARAEAIGRIVNLFYRPYQTRDGAIFVGALTRNLRDKARAALGTDFMGRDDPNFDARDDGQMEKSLEQQALVETRVKSGTTAQWIEILENAGVPTGEVLFPEDLWQEPQLIENYYVAEVEHEAAGRQVHVAPPAQFGRFPEPVLKGAPSLGRDNGKYIEMNQEETT